MLLETDELLKPVAYVLKTETDRAIEVSSKPEEWINRFVRAAKRTVFFSLSQTTEFTSTDISNGGTIGKAYSITD